MNGSKGENPDGKGVTFVPSTGSVIGGIHRDKTGRITDAMADLQLGIDGLRSRFSDVCDGNLFALTLSSFARSSSVFLRKTVLGDHNRRETRLLDDRFLESTGLLLMIAHMRPMRDRPNQAS